MLGSQPLSPPGHAPWEERTEDVCQQKLTPVLRDTAVGPGSMGDKSAFKFCRGECTCVLEVLNKQQKG